MALLQEHEAESKAAEAAESAPGASKSRVPEKGEDMSDKDVSKLIVVKQSRARQGGDERPQEGGPPHRGQPADEAHVISDGLQFYERELQVWDPVSPSGESVDEWSDCSFLNHSQARRFDN